MFCSSSPRAILDFKELSITNIEQAPRELQAPEAKGPEDKEHVRSNGSLN